MSTRNPSGAGVGARLSAVSGKIKELKQALQKVASREADIMKLKAETDGLRDQLIERVDQMESEVVEAIAMAVQEVAQDSAATEALRQEKMALEGDLQMKEEAIRTRDAMISELEGKLGAVTTETEGNAQGKTKLREIQRWLNVLSDQLADFTQENTIALNETEIVEVKKQENGDGQAQTHAQAPAQSQAQGPGGFKIVLEK